MNSTDSSAPTSSDALADLPTILEELDRALDTQDEARRRALKAVSVGPSVADEIDFSGLRARLRDLAPRLLTRLDTLDALSERLVDELRKLLDVARGGANAASLILARRRIASVSQALNEAEIHLFQEAHYRDQGGQG